MYDSKGLTELFFKKCPNEISYKALQIKASYENPKNVLFTENAA